MPIRVAIAYMKGGAHFAIFEDKAQTPGNRLERAEGVRSISHPVEEHLCRGIRSRLPVQFLIRGGVHVV